MNRFGRCDGKAGKYARAILEVDFAGFVRLRLHVVGVEYWDQWCQLFVFLE